MPGPGWADQRWDPGYWHPRLQAPLAEMRYPSRPLGAFIDAITYGPIVTRKNAQPEALNAPRGIPVIGQKQLLDLGLNLAGSERVRPGSIYDPARARVRRGDLLIPRSGAGSLGRNRLAVYEGSGPATVSCFVDRLRLKGIRPRYVAAFLKSKPGRLQLQRAANGAGTVNVNFAELRALEIPLAPVDVQRRLARLVSRTQRNGTDAGDVIRETERLLSRTA